MYIESIKSEISRCQEIGEFTKAINLYDEYREELELEEELKEIQIALSNLSQEFTQNEINRLVGGCEVERQNKYGSSTYCLEDKTLYENYVDRYGDGQILKYKL